MTLLYLILAALAAAGFYLASPHQRRWPTSRGQARHLRRGACLCFVGAVCGAIQLLGLWAGLFAALTALMLVAVALPYVHAYQLLKYKERDHVG